MKLVSYNILAGGFTSYNYTDKIPQRIELIKKSLKNFKSDFVGLIDTFRWDSIYSNDDLKRMFNFKHAYCVNLEDERLINIGHNNGIAVLSNFDNTSFETVRLVNRNCIKAKITIDDSTLEIFTVYLDDLSEETRLKQINSLFQYLNEKTPTIIMGDLNTYDPRDSKEVEENKKIFETENPELYNIYKHSIFERQKGEVVKAIIDHKFRDSSDKFIATNPTLLLPHARKRGYVRIDYIFVSTGILIKKYGVYKNKTADQTSDHYPIYLEFEI